MPEKKILVTGGCGYIGSHVVRQLSEQGYEAVVLDNLSTGHKDALLHGERLVVLDLAEQDKIKNLMQQEKFDAVMHFAASIVVPESVTHPIKYYRNNTVNTINLVEACVENHIPHFIFSSTAAVYGESAQNPVKETDPLNPMNPYGRSKLMDEWIIEDTAFAHGLSYVTLRYFNVAGADLKGRMGQRVKKATHLIKVACETALGKYPQFTIYGNDYPTKDGTCVRDFIHIEDLADAHIKSLEYLFAGGKNATFNCGYNEGYSVRDIVNVVNEVVDKPISFIYGPRRPGDAPALVSDNTLIKQTLNWQPKFNQIDTIVKSAYMWEQNLLT